MEASRHSLLESLLTDLLGQTRRDALLAQLHVPAVLANVSGLKASRALLAQVLNMVLFEDLLARVPAARERVRDVVAEGAHIFFDHGALRTVCTPFPTALPSGYAAFARILEPLGYRVTNVYPLTRISMTGRSYTHEDYPEEIAQFFVSELHLGGFSTRFQSAAQQVLSSSRDPVTPRVAALLARVALDLELPYVEALELLRGLLPCFGRQHTSAPLSAYETLLAESAEMAWIATEGHTFNHVTERVRDVATVAEQQKQLGRPMKDAIEVSRSGRVRQTAYFAAQVERELVAADGTLTKRIVPGSFYEFIQRAHIPVVDGRSRLDLGFDSSNAQGIFRMTAAA